MVITLSLIIDERPAHNTHIESILDSAEIIRLVIPKTTLDLLKAQKANSASGASLVKSKSKHCVI